jgi:hypothetical protein
MNSYELPTTRNGEEAFEQSLSDWFVVIVPDTEAGMAVIEHLEAIQARDMKVEEFDGGYRIRWRQSRTAAKFAAAAGIEPAWCH